MTGSPLYGTFVRGRNIGVSRRCYVAAQNFSTFKREDLSMRFKRLFIECLVAFVAHAVQAGTLPDGAGRQHIMHPQDEAVGLTDIRLDGKGVAFFNAEGGAYVPRAGDVFRLTGRETLDATLSDGLLRNAFYVPNANNAETPLSFELQGFVPSAQSPWAYGVAAVVYAKTADGEDGRFNIRASGGTLTAVLKRPAGEEGPSDPSGPSGGQPGGGSDGEGPEDLFPEVVSGHGSTPVPGSDGVDDVVTNAGLKHMAAESDRIAGLMRQMTMVARDLQMPLQDVLYLQAPLLVTEGTHVVIGSRSETDANFLLGGTGALMLEASSLMPGAGADDGLLLVRPGAKVVFEEGSAMLVTDPNGDGFLARALGLEAESASVEGRPVFSVDASAQVTGLDRLLVVQMADGIMKQMRLEETGDGRWCLHTAPWHVTGPFGDAVEALAGRVSAGTASEDLRTLFRFNVTPERFGRAVAQMNLLQKGLGTTTAMERLTLEGAVAAGTNPRRYEHLRPFDVSIRHVRSEGRAPGVDSKGDVRSMGISRTSNGLTLSLHGALGPTFAGATLAYEDAETDIDNLSLPQNRSMTADSTVLAANAYLGRQVNWGYAVLQAGYAGAEDKTRVTQAGRLTIGVERLRRRSASAGASGVLTPAVWDGWRTGLTVGGYVTYYLATDYDVGINGVNAWSVREDARTVGTVHVGADLAKRWDPTPRSWVKLTMSAGALTRTGDTDVTQTMAVDGVRASFVSKDLGRTEAWMTLGLDGEFRGGAYGLRGTKVVGTDGADATSAEVRLTWSI